jgi:hypothetical protein
MKQISILFMCLFCSMLTMAQTTESITINGASSEGFITNISFSGNDAMVTYENGTQQTIDMAGLSIDFDYVALLDDADDEQTSTMMNTFGGKEVNVELSRPIASGQWNTLCVPFNMSADQIESVFGAGTSVAVFSNAENDVVNFSTANEITAGIPCILYPANTVNKISLSNIPMKNFLAPGSVKSTDYTFVGTLATTSPAGTIFYFANGNQIKKLTADGSIKAFRAYFASNGQEARLFSVDGIITAINTIKDEIQPDNTPAYNISGQRVSKDYKGIVIKNGKKAIIQ